MSLCFGDEDFSNSIEPSLNAKCTKYDEDADDDSFCFCDACISVGTYLYFIIQ